MTDVTPPTPPADGTPPPPPPVAPAPQAPAPQAAPAPAPGAPAPQAAPAPQPAAPAAPPRPPANPGSATSLIWRRRDRATLVGALSTVLIAWIIEIVRQVLILVQSFSYAIDDGFGSVLQAFGDFAFFGIWRPLFFFVLVFLALWMFLPIVKESTLATVLKRTAASGLAGLVGLLFFGLVTAIYNSVRFGFYFGYFGVDFIWQPIIIAFTLTISLLVGATITWLRANRPAKAAPAAPAAPTVPVAPTNPPPAPPAI